MGTDIVCSGAEGFGQVDRSQMSPPYRQSSSDDVLSPLSDDGIVFATDNMSGSYGSARQPSS